MDLSIQGNFEPYFYVVLWQITLSALQQLGLQTPNPQINNTLNVYATAMRMFASALSWLTWMLAFWIGLQINAASGVTFCILGFAASFGTLIILHRHPDIVIPMHAISLPAMPYFAYRTLMSLGLTTGF